MKKHKNLWISISSIVLAMLIFSVLLLIQQSMKKEPELKTILCAKEGIEKQVVITKENASRYLEERQVPVALVPEGVPGAAEELYGQMTLVDVTKGSILTKSMCAMFGKEYQDYECLSWVSVPVKELYEGVAGTVRAGDYIDIYSLWREGDEMCSERLLEHVQVQGVFSAQGKEIEGNESGLSQLIIVPIERKEVAAFYEKLAKGNVRIAKYEEI